MIFISRNDKSFISRWWWTIDQWNLLQIIVLAAIGSILMFTVGAKVAEKHNLPELYFFKKDPLINGYLRAEGFCKQVISLPIYPYLKEEEVKYICKCIQEFYAI